MRWRVAVYTTPALEKKGLRSVSDPIEVVLYALSNVKDTDFMAKLLDVYPGGGAFKMHYGILLERYRNGYERHV
jgi:predicted acyl esterase